MARQDVPEIMTWPYRADCAPGEHRNRPAQSRVAAARTPAETQGPSAIAGQAAGRDGLCRVLSRALFCLQILTLDPSTNGERRQR